jgi:hypothetical protein
LHLCWQAQPAEINRTRHSLVRTRDTRRGVLNNVFCYPCVTVNYINKGLRATPLHWRKQCGAANHKNHQNHPKITVQTTGAGKHTSFPPLVGARLRTKYKTVYCAEGHIKNCDRRIGESGVKSSNRR